MKGRSIAALISMAVLILGVVAVHAQTFTTIYSFPGTTGGSGPYSGLITANGNLYGVTILGGDINTACTNGCGTVYSLDSNLNETVLQAFPAGSDGAFPMSPLAMDSTGNIYGTASEFGYWSHGVVFKIDTSGNYTVLYSFTGQDDGCFPLQGVIFDKSGNMYGTTSGCDATVGGATVMGSIYEIDNTGNFHTLHTFYGTSSDGSQPEYGNLIMDSSGNLYGLTCHGGAYNNGTMYELNPTTQEFTLLYSFGGKYKSTTYNDGICPSGSITPGSIAGTYYGTTTDGGKYNSGTIWTATVAKTTTETIKYSFTGGSDGEWPLGTVTADALGNLYGTTAFGGSGSEGTLFELPAGKTQVSVLHAFTTTPDGANPVGELMWSSDGILYGTTENGGPSGVWAGTVFTYTPAQSYTLSASPNTLSVAQGGLATSTITVVPLGGFNENVSLSASGLPSGVTAAFNPNPATRTSTMTLTAAGTAKTGNSTVTVKGTSGSSSVTTTLTLTVTAPAGVSLTPSSLTFSKETVGKTSAAKSVTLKNTGGAVLNINSITVSGSFAISANTCGTTLAPAKTCKVSVTFTPTQVGTATGTLSFADSTPNSPQTVTLTGTGD